MINKKVLLTGGSGFIGANLVRKLIRLGYDTTLLLRKNSNIWRVKDIINNTRVIKIDLLEKDKLSKAVYKIKPDLVYHLATYGAYSYQNEPEKILNTNIFGTLNLIEACKNTEIELFVNTGSSSEYGFKKKPMKEDDFLEPNSFYSISKATQTHLSNFMSRNYQLPIVTLRPFSVYGPYEEPGRLIPNLLKAAYFGNKIKMVQKNIVRDFIYIDDYIDICLKIDSLKKFSGQIFNVGTGVQTNFENLIKIFEKVTNKKINIEWENLENKSWDTDHWRANTDKVCLKLKVRNFTSLYLGLQKNWKWFKNNHQLYVENN